MAFITLDFETFYDKGYSLTALTYEQYIKNPLFHVHGVGIQVDDGERIYYPDRDVKEIMHETFPTNNDHTLIAHNALFDGAITSWYYGLRAKKYSCTQAISRALWNQSSSSLDALTKRLFSDDPSMWKGNELVQFRGIERLSDEEQVIMGGYCKQDIKGTFGSFAKMWPMMPEEELAILDLTLQMAIHPGFVLDVDIVQEHLEDIKQQKLDAIAASGTNKTTLASGPKFVKYIKATFGLDVPIIDSPTPKNPANRKYTLAKDELVGIQFVKDHPEVKQAFLGRYSVASTQEVARATRLLQHAGALPHKAEGVISLPLNYAKAHTLRWGGANKINPQNFGRKSPLRRAIKAPEGFVIGVGDLSNIEARVLAWWAEEEGLIAMYRNKLDVYNIYGEKIYGRPVNRKLEIPHPETGELYKPDYIEGHVAKTTVLGLGYQMGPAKFQGTLEGGANGGPPVFLPFDMCHHIVHGVFRAENRAIVQAWGECNKVIIDMIALKPGESYMWRHLRVEHGRLRLPNGMYLNYPGLRCVEDENGGYPEYQYWNGKFMTKIYPGKLTENIIQALARIILSTQMLEINDYLGTTHEQARILLTVHDELVALLHLETAEPVMDTVINMMKVAPAWCSDENLILDAEGGFDVCYSK